jgi:hypoxanthine phosphoribosyltransferase
MSKLTQLYSVSQLESLIAELGDEIAGLNYDVDAIAVPLLVGGMFFASDVLRAAMWTGEIYPVIVGLYEGQVVSSGNVELHSALPNVKGRDVLLIDDILDSGKTLAAMGKHMKDIGCLSCGAVTLLAKDIPDPDRRTEMLAEHLMGPVITGPEVKDFVVGYGMDLEGRYRAAPVVYSWKGDGNEYIH